MLPPSLGSKSKNNRLCENIKYYIEYMHFKEAFFAVSSLFASCLLIYDAYLLMKKLYLMSDLYLILNACKLIEYNFLWDIPPK
jgi:hypothetical protein